MPYVISALIGYLIGAIPFGVVTSRLRRGRDPRQSGSRHTGALNTLRSADRIAFVMTGVGDISKGVAAVGVVRALGFDDAAAVTTSVAAIVGHCWSIYIGFNGGMGVGTFIGLTVYWLPVGLLVLVPLWFALFAMIRHAPRTSVIAGLSPGPVLALLGGSTPAIAFGIVGGLLVAVRHLHDWRRVFDNG